MSPSGAAQAICSIRQPPVHLPSGPNVHPSSISNYPQLPIYPLTRHLPTHLSKPSPSMLHSPTDPLIYQSTYLLPIIHLISHSSTQCASTHVLIPLSTPAYSTMRPSTLPPTYHLFIFPLSPFIYHPNTHPLSHSSLHHLHTHPPIMHPFPSRPSTPIYPPCTRPSPYPSLIPLSIYKLD